MTLIIPPYLNVSLLLFQNSAVGQATISTFFKVLGEFLAGEGRVVHLRGNHESEEMARVRFLIFFNTPI